MVVRGQILSPRDLIEHFLSEDLVDTVGIYRAWVEYPFISDHALILLQLDLPPLYKAYPFKFNPLWTKENEFILMVQKLWKDPKYLKETGKQKHLVWKLKDLKVITKVWQKDRKKSKNARLCSLENEISYRIQNMVEGLCNTMKDTPLKYLENERNTLLKEIEEQWRQRSRAIWIKSGDLNTKFFHNFASFRRNSKYVWEIHGEEGQVYSGQENIKSTTLNHFKDFYKEQRGSSTMIRLGWSHYFQK
jgi:hypothetical protein